MHSDFDCLEWTEQNIGEEFRGCTGSKIDQGSIHVWSKFVAINMLENFVETILSEALERISDKGWSPAKENTSDSFSSEYF